MGGWVEQRSSYHSVQRAERSACVCQLAFSFPNFTLCQFLAYKTILISCRIVFSLLINPLWEYSTGYTWARSCDLPLTDLTICYIHCYILKLPWKLLSLLIMVLEKKKKNTIYGLTEHNRHHDAIHMQLLINKEITWLNRKFNSKTIFIECPDVPNDRLQKCWLDRMLEWPLVNSYCIN